MDDAGEGEWLTLRQGVSDEPPPRQEGEGWLGAALRQDNPDESEATS